MRQVLGSEQVAQEEGQAKQFGEERYCPDSHAKQAVMAPAVIEQLTHPMDRA